ncbi:hypothetical protein [Roseibium aggregatum]|uniref:hypothetical protein n=1 Tax=Roseibium aggregatum TaxID=187304 RepID=UPI003A978EB7
MQTVHSSVFVDQDRETELVSIMQNLPQKPGMNQLAVAGKVTGTPQVPGALKRLPKASGLDPSRFSKLWSALKPSRYWIALFPKFEAVRLDVISYVA